MTDRPVWAPVWMPVVMGEGGFLREGDGVTGHWPAGLLEAMSNRPVVGPRLLPSDCYTLLGALAVLFGATPHPGWGARPPVWPAPSALGS